MNADEQSLILWLSASGPCSMDHSPKSNWVQKGGGLPNYICHIAQAVARGGHSTSQAIAIAVGTAKRWAAGGKTNGATGHNVTAATRAKAAAAVAQWEALRAKAHAGHVVKASHPQGLGTVLMLTDVGSFNTDMVRQAWAGLQRDLLLGHQPWITADWDRDGDNDAAEFLPSAYIIQLWSDYLIVEFYDDGETYYAKVPYTIDGNTVKFDNPVRVEQRYIETNDPIPDDDDDDADGKEDDGAEDPGDEFTDDEHDLLMHELATMYPAPGALTRLSRISKGL